MEDMGSYFRKWREWRNGNLGNKSSMSIKGAKENQAKDIQSANQLINQSIKINQSTQCQSTNPSFQQAFNNFSILIPCASQVSSKFPTVLFH